MKDYNYIIISCFLISLILSCDKYSNKFDLYVADVIGNNSTDHIHNYITRSASFGMADTLIYVGDSGDKSIKIFTTDGSYLKKFGRYGRGPGEFNGALKIAVNNDHTLTAYDFNLQKLIVFSENGETLSEFLTDQRHNTPFLKFGDLLISGHGAVPFQTDLQKESLLYAYNMDGEIVRKFGTFPILNNPLPSIFLRYTIRKQGNRLYLLYTYIPLMEVYNLDNFELIHSYKLHNIHPYTTLSNSELFNTAPKDLSTEMNNNITGFTFDMDEQQSLLMTDVGDSLFFHLYDLDDQINHIDSYSFPKKTNKVIAGALDLQYNSKTNSIYVLENNDQDGFVIVKYQILE